MKSQWPSKYEKERDLATHRATVDCEWIVIDKDLLRKRTTSTGILFFGKMVCSTADAVRVRQFILRMVETTAFVVKKIGA